MDSDAAEYMQTKTTDVSHAPCVNSMPMLLLPLLIAGVPHYLEERVVYLQFSELRQTSQVTDIPVELVSTKTQAGQVTAGLKLRQHG